MLPSMVNDDGIKKYKQVSFGGYNHTLGARDGEIWDMKNMTSDFYPLLSPRRKRYKTATVTKPNGFYARDGIYWVDGTELYADGEKVNGMTLTDGHKKFVFLGAYLVILPDRKYYNISTKECGSIEKSYTSGENSVSFKNGEIYGENAECNTLYCENVDFTDYFNVGDGVEISGCTKHTENNQTPIIREISEDGHSLRFYENVFILDGDDGLTDYTEPNGITVARKMPDMDFICENENRLWGCKGDTIYSSKLGDIFNWNVFDGISTDSYAVNVGSAGDFTGCCSYLGYPIFFKEEHIYKVYGDKPSNFQVMSSASLGVETGSDESISIAGETLFYLSRTGIVAYTGGIPQSISGVFGTERYKNAVGGSDGIKYYVSMQDTKGAYHIFVYDTQKKLWHKEDSRKVTGFGWNGEMYFLDSGGELWLSGNAREIPTGAAAEEKVEWSTEWADFYEYTSYSNKSSPIPEKKGIGKLLIRLELDENSNVTIEMKFDSGDEWQTVKTLETEKKRSYYLPIIPRRCDHFRIRLRGEGGCRLYSLVRECYTGSEL